MESGCSRVFLAAARLIEIAWELVVVIVVVAVAAFISLLLDLLRDGMC